jgi:2'-hydroxyisoflavone reductase
MGAMGAEPPDAAHATHTWSMGMHRSRREFLQTAAATGALMSVGAPSVLARSAVRRREGKKILILGGTAFVGPAIVGAAKARGHSLTLFNRGRTEKRIGMIDGVEHLYGNRDPKLRADDSNADSPMGLESLKDRTWDAVVDTSGQYVRIVKASAELLAPSIQQYVYISSLSVYKDNSIVDGEETQEVHTLEDPSVETMGKNFENYGGLKATCEKTVEAALPGRTTAVRPGLIVGPGDQTDRFTYWPVRIKRGGEVLAPGTPADPIQIIDVRDLGEWIVHLIETGTMGTFDTVGPPTGLTMGRMLEACVSVSRSDARLTWADAAFLEEQNVSAWGDMPVWVPPKGDSAGFHRRTVKRASAAGLKFRPIETTVADTLAWFPGEIERRKRVTKEMREQAEKEGKPPPQMQDPEKLRAGISPKREAEVLKAWHERHG